jgi:hypothetical protein
MRALTAAHAEIRGPLMYRGRAGRWRLRRLAHCPHRRQLQPHQRAMTMRMCPK